MPKRHVCFAYKSSICNPTCCANKSLICKSCHPNKSKICNHAKGLCEASRSLAIQIEDAYASLRHGYNSSNCKRIYDLLGST